MRPLSETWEALRSLEPASLPTPLRTRLAELWARDALLEHASVASFSKFSLHLMAVAAPPALLHDAHRAALDEIQHARLCFALASAYAGEPLGPGPLPLEGDLLGPLDLPTISAAAVREGCIGETLASLEAAEAHEQARAQAPREALGTIAEDEARHAELAWRFVRWAIDQGDEATRVAVERAFREALQGPRPEESVPDPMEEELAYHGRLSERQRSLLWTQGLFEVVKPAAEALLGRVF
ncbi:MAG: ferritin-like domain-containing protein [Myxococcales bacterium]|nr:ferritin-like domain-containing protein [Polyangiaceae bacterium]MDW8249111.1 ferritin-like domain-containing protein [Myxococcales bacterium]